MYFLPAIIVSCASRIELAAEVGNLFTIRTASSILQAVRNIRLAQAGPVLHRNVRIYENLGLPAGHDSGAVFLFDGPHIWHTGRSGKTGTSSTPKRSTESVRFSAAG